MNKYKFILHTLSLTTGLIGLFMFYLVGGWKLVIAAMLFGWSMNIQNSAKEGA